MWTHLYRRRVRYFHKLSFKGARGINYLRKVNLDCYAYVVAAVRMLGEDVEEVVYSFEEYLN